MNDDEIVNRLSLISVIRTPTGRYANRIVRVERTAVTVASELTQHERTIPYNDIRHGATRHGCIIRTLRRILGLNN